MRDTLAGRTFAWRALIGVAAVMAGAALVADALVTGLMPLYRIAFEGLAPELRVLALEAGTEAGHRVVLAKVTLARLTVVGQTALWPDARGVATASTPLAHALHLPAAAILVSAAWPAASLARTGARILLATAVAALCMPVDLPAVLAGTLWHILLDQYAPGAFSPLLLWCGFLSGGGRWMLGAVIGMLAAVVVSDRSAARPPDAAGALPAGRRAKTRRGRPSPHP